MLKPEKVKMEEATPGIPVELPPQFKTVERTQAQPPRGFKPLERKIEEVETDPYQEARPFMDLIGAKESNNDYTVAYGGTKHDFTSMSIDDVLAWQDEFVAGGSKSSAVGRYQIIRKTMRDLKRTMGLKGDEMFNEEMQDKMFVHLMKRRGYDKWLNGEIEDEQFANNLAKEWASLPVIETGRSYYAGDGLNKALISPEEVLAALGKERMPASLVQPEEQQVAEAPQPTKLEDGIYEDNGRQIRMQGGRMYDLRTGERLDVDPVQDTGPDVGTIRAGQSTVGEINAIVNPPEAERQATLGDRFAGSGNASVEGMATTLKELTGANLGPNVVAALDAGDTQGAVMEAALEILPPGLEELARSMFVGVKSAAATDRVNKAIKMDEAGASVDEIKQATNMHRGPDGLWRDEISDAASVVKPEVEFLPTGKAAIDRMGQTRFSNKSSMPDLPDIFVHDELYELYPELKNIKISLLPESASANGTMFLSEGVLGIHPRLLREGGDAARIKILHEIQHQVQMYEGFIGGGAVAKTAQQNWAKAKKNIRLAPQDYPSLKDFGETAWVNVGQKLNAGENVDDLIKNLSPEAQAYVKSNAGRWARQRQELQDAFDDYLRIHGEAEARITEKSVNMSTAERAGSNPYDRDYRNPVKDKQFKDTEGRNLQPMDEPAFKDSFAVGPVMDEKYFKVVDRGADFDEVMDRLNEFDPDMKRIVKALDKADWMGFDTPAEALRAILRGEVEDMPSGLKSALGRMVNTGGTPL